MFRVTIRSFLANKIRFALTTFGVILAVSFVVGAFVLGDGLRSSFTDVSEEITAGIDLEVRAAADFGDTPPLPAETVGTVSSIDGVAAAAAAIEAADNAVRPIPPSGTPITTEGPPQLAYAWIDNEQLSAFTLVEGTAPRAGEFTMDIDSVATHGFVVGDAYQVMVPGGQVELTLSGTTTFGTDNATLGAVLMQMNAEQASELFGIAGITSVAVQVDDGADLATVQAAIAAAVPGADVVDNATILAETTTEFTSEIDMVGNILLGFGGVALLVSVFIIYNTFAIVLAQRSRELALLRAVGAAPKQIRRSALGEALAIGVIASVGGIGGGIGVAIGIEALFGVMGVKLADHPMILAGRTVVVAVIVGIGATLVAAIGPARRAGTQSPVALLGGGAETAGMRSRRRFVAGVGLVAAGLAAGATGLAGLWATSGTVVALALGAVTMFLGVTLLSPLAVGAITSAFGWPMRALAGVAGRLAQLNASRHARRTATTAAALTIGLALVTGAFVVGESVKASLGSAMERSVRADYIVSDNLPEVDFPKTLVDDLRQMNGIDTVVGFTHFEARVGGSVTDVVGLDFDQVGAVLDLDVSDGSFLADATHRVVVSDGEAAASGAVIGDRIVIETADGYRVEATVVGLFHDQAILTEDYLLDSSILTEAGVPLTADWIALSIVDGASPATVGTLVTEIAERHPYADVETTEEFQDRMKGTIDGMLAMLNVMVALAVVIALIGIANTLALSVLERTRELGLVRAVGMTRRQVRRMVRLESVLVATFGATIGVGLGLVFGLGVVGALPSAFSSNPSVPIVPILVVIVIAASAAVVAAWLPARRAGHLDVLDAIAH
jgi:putative ABC transport system permease protein